MKILLVGVGNIGFEITKLISDNDSLLIIARNLPDYLKSYMHNRDNIKFYSCDATNADAMLSLIESSEIKEFGQADVLITTPGTSTESTIFTDFDDFKRCFNTNYFANIIPIKTIGNELLKNNGGRIILLSATSGHHADKRLSGYPSSKWALENTYSSLREEMRSRGITVDVIAVRTIKNKYSKVWTQKYGEDPLEIASLVNNLMSSPKNKRHFIPRRFSLIRLIERLCPRLLDYKHGLKNHSTRRKLFSKYKIDSILITGAASGLGKALSHQYVANSKILYLCDIDYEGLVAVKKELNLKSDCQIEIAKVDLFNESEILEYVNSIDGVDLIINNAAVRYNGPILETAIETFKQNFDINFFAPLLLISKLFSKTNQPKKIVNILSTTAIRGRKHMSLYSSSKSALWYMSRSLRRTLGHNIQVLEVIPSTMTSTKLIENSIVIKEEDEEIKGRNKKPQASIQSNVKFLNVGNWSSFDAARLINKYERSGKEILFIPPIRARLFLALDAFSDKLFLLIFKN